MPENEKLCRNLLKRLQFLHDYIEPLDSKDASKVMDIDVVVRFLKLMRGKPLLKRLASTEAITMNIREQQINLSHVGLALGLEDEPEMKEWETQQAAEGLQFLHERGVVHGGLKCSSILVGANYTAKVIQSGCRNERSLPLRLSSNAVKYLVESIRWKPKEILQEELMDAPNFESDIYSLGMCMLEAITQEPPFGNDGDDEVVEKIMRGERHRRPDNVSDTAWGLISRLCDPEIDKRPALSDVIDQILEFTTMHIDPTQPFEKSRPQTVGEVLKSISCSSCLESVEAIIERNDVNIVALAFIREYVECNDLSACIAKFGTGDTRLWQVFLNVALHYGTRTV
ncbi:hypothetical protein PHYPSEUDO_003900 [Phytophthora pseudosyringae]|uniref:non-specific serine/threonine protein kinase n=1 Tax=Phytophthora pseudosyringae TaxID=221518 RepID=A0A8T1VTE1_9STRA|nr:hypothetical protein PHYPSEUDO_003900 [Phytophthora pseudosyringae]